MNILEIRNINPPDVNIIDRRDLDQYQSLDQLMPYGKVIILYAPDPQKMNKKTGHFVSLLKRNDGAVEFFDSIGSEELDGRKIDGHGIPDDQLFGKYLGKKDYLKKLMKESGYPIYYSEYHLQGNKSANCPLWSSFRLNFPHLNEDEFADMIWDESDKYGITPDDLIYKIYKESRLI